MNLQGRNLKPNMRGDDVKLRQDELRQLGLNIGDLEGSFGSTTFLAVQEFQRQHDLPATGIVDAKTARIINVALDAQPRETYLVHGRLLQADGDPVPEARVRALEKLLRREQRLGQASVDERGNYEITYPIPQNANLSLIVRAVDAQGNGLAASAVICAGE